MSATAIETAQAAAAPAVRRWPARALLLDLISARVLDATLAGAVFITSLAVYCATLAPGLIHVTIGGLDGPELATVPARLGLLHSPGYPFYTWVGKLFTYLPLGDVAYRMNLMSAVSAAGAVALLYGIVLLLSGSRTAAVFTALLFAFSSTLWSQAVIAEVYGPNMFMLALTLLLILRWDERMRRRDASAAGDRSSTVLFAAACLTFGLSLGTHLSNVALIPALAVYVLLIRERRHIPLRTLVIGGGLFLLALCQFLWLPLRASTLNDKLMLEHAPNGWLGIFDYMFNVFHSCSFGFPYLILAALPERLAAYGGLLLENFGPWGIALAVVGVGSLLLRRRKVFWLLAIGGSVEVLYFTAWNYNEYDMEIFLLPAQLIFAVFVGLGVRWLWEQPARLRVGEVPVRACLGFLLLLPLALQMHANWSDNNHSHDTTIEDFYKNVFRVLPENSMLVGKSGIPGFDLFHYPMVDGLRQDVTIPQTKNPFLSLPEEMQGRPAYSTVDSDVHSDHGDIAFPKDAWLVPILAAPFPYLSWLGGIPLTLYEVRGETPPLFVDNAAPQHQVGRVMDGVEFVGFDLDRTEVAAGGTLHITLYWRPLKAPALNYYRVSTVLGDGRYRETHTLGFGLMRRYQQERRLPPKEIIVEDYDLVVMSSLPKGEHTLRLATCDFGAFGAKTEEWLELAEIRVVD